jgi:hypothetical protein
VNFAVSGPHRYSYEIVNHGETVDLIARGDLDCDGVTSLFQITIYADMNTNSAMEFYIEDELE